MAQYNVEVIFGAASVGGGGSIPTTTDDLTEGGVNLYFTDARVAANAAVAASTAHAALTNNPHGVTLAQVGGAAASHTHPASDVTDFDAEVSNNTSVAANTAHRSLTNNPHSVTAAQLGAVTGPATSTGNTVAAWGDATGDSLLATSITTASIASTITQSHQHTNKAQLDLVTDGDHDVRTDNPHGVTLAQVGAAASSHTHEIDELDATGITSGYVLAADGANGAAFVAPATVGASWDGHTELSDIAWTDFVITANQITGQGGAALVYSTWKIAQRVLVFVPTGGDYGYFSVQLPHGYAPGEDIHPHVHFASPSAIANGATVTFRITYTAANVGDVFPSESTVDMTYTNSTGSSVAGDTHLIAGGATIDGTNFELSTVLHCRIERLSSDTHEQSVNLLSMDFHIPFNRLGSENEYTG